MTDSTSSDPGQAGRPAPTIQELVAIVACYDSRHEAATAGFSFGSALHVGDVAVIEARGRWRVGVILRIGQLNADVEYTTEGALREAADMRSTCMEPYRSIKTARFANIGVRPTAQPAPGAATADRTDG